MQKLFIILVLVIFPGQSISNNFKCDIKEIFTTYNSRDSCSKDGFVNETPKKNDCSLYKSVIDNDLKPFEQGIEKHMIDAVENRGTRYQIVNHKLYRQKECMFPSRCSGVEYFMKKLLSELPDMEIILNCRDWPQLLKNHGKISPIFSFSKTKDYLDIMYPTWGFWEGGPAISLYPTGLGRWDKHRISITEASKKFPWDKKINKAFFRGSRTSDERDSLVLLSRKNTDLVDAQYTKNQAWKSPKDTLDAEPATEVTLEEHCKYKFLFNFRGVAASFRFKHLFLCKSLVFHVGSEWKEFFYEAMVPGVHYVPVKSYPSQWELEEIIKYYQEHDNEARSVAEKGYNFIRKHLRMKDVECYWEHLLKTYGALIKYKIVVKEDYIRVS